MTGPEERLEASLNHSDRSKAAFYIGKLGSKDLVEVAVPHLVAPDGSLRLIGSQLIKLANKVAQDDIVWVQRANDERAVEELEPTVLADGRVVIDHQTMQLFVDGEDKKLPPAPYQVLEFLAQHAGRVVKREEMMTAIWGGYTHSSRKIDVHINVIRRTLGEGLDDIVRTRWNLGYFIQREDIVTEATPPVLTS